MSSTATATATATSSGIKISPYLFLSDKIVLEKLIEDAKSADVENNPDDAAIAKLAALCDPTSDDFEVTVFTSWDLRDLVKSLPPSVNRYLLQPYIRWGSTVVRRNTDVVFITHVLLYLSTIFPSAILLYRHFSWYHGVAHTVWAVLNAGPFTLMLHNHIHNNGVLAPSWWVLDKLFPYILEPLFGHTWDSYFYHHVKHHHAEGNGPDDLSSTIRYQRDELTHFLMYLGRFMFLAWIELPIYFLRKKRYGLAARSLVTELTAYSFVVAMARYSFRPSLFVFILPLVIMRIGMMLGNWGQHAFVDEDEPMSSLRSSITLIDIAVSILTPVALQLIHRVLTCALEQPPFV